MKKYDSYKDSGIEWLGDVPEHWNVVRLTYLCNIGTGDKDTENREDDGEYPFFVRSQTIERISTYTFDGEAILTAGDGVGVCKVWHYINGKFDCHQRVYRLSHFKGINGRFLFYYIRHNFTFEVMKLSAKSTVDSLRRPMFQNFRVTFGSLAEQTLIANYLDHKTQQIDELIAKKERLIELLNEERTATINQAVTKGINPNVPMKDSGIEWLGEIPEHWEVKRLRYIGQCQNGISEGADYFGAGYPFLTYGDVYKNEIIPKELSGLAKSTEKDQDHFSVKEGDVFFTRTSETIEEIGIVSTCMDDVKNAVFAGFLIRFRPFKGKLNKEFSRYYFRCTLPRIFFIKEMNLVTRASLSQELLKRLPVLLPTLEEQQAIAQYLKTNTLKIDNAISKISQEIDLLKEYKTALISEAVTGKIDIRDQVLN